MVGQRKGGDGSPAETVRTMTRRVIRSYHAFNFFFSLLFWAPIFYEYQKQMGLVDSEIFGIQSLYYLAFCFLELPTGFLADKFGHRWSLRWAAFILILANLLPVFWVSFAGFLCHWFMMAVARSLMSGSASAYLYEFLEREGQSDWYRKTEGRARALSLVGRVAAWSVVGPLMAWQITLPYWLTAISGVFAFMVSLRLPEETKQLTRPVVSGVWRVLASTPRLWLMMSAGLTIFVLARLVQVNLFQPILEHKGYSVTTFGLVLGLTTLFEAAGSALGDKMAEKWGELQSLIFLTVAMAVSTSLLGGPGKTWAFILLSVFALACGLAYPIQRKLLNDAIPEPGLRATLLSVESLLDRLFCSAMAAGVAVLMSGNRMGLALELGGGITLMVTAVLVYSLARSVETTEIHRKL